VHAEINAILNATSSTDESTLYTSLFPCSNCAKICVQAGVKEIIYEQDIYNGTEDDTISKKIFSDSGIKTRKIDAIKINVE